MTPIGKNGSFILWGTVTFDAKVREARTGNKYATFGLKYNRGHNEDGQMVNESIDVTVWDTKYIKNADFVGDQDIGIAKGDTVLVCGELVEDTFRKEGEDPNIKKWKVNADIVIDMTSIFQVAQMVVNGSLPQAEMQPTPAKPQFTEERNKTPFEEELDDADGELPF